jgi:hypothetical protein
MAIIRTMGVYGNGLVISGEQIGRSMSIGSNWQYIRIGFLYQISSSASQLTSIRWNFGLTAGTQSLYNDATCQSFYGIRSIDDRTWSRTLSGGGQYYVYTSAPNTYNTEIVFKTGSTVDILNPDTMSAHHPQQLVTSDFQRSFTVFMDYYKLSENGGPTQLYMSASIKNATGEKSISKAQFRDYLQVSPDGLPYPVLTKLSAPLTESVNGYLDTINLSWRVSGSMILHSIGAYIFE